MIRAKNTGSVNQQGLDQSPVGATAPQPPPAQIGGGQQPEAQPMTSMWGSNPKAPPGGMKGVGEVWANNTIPGLSMVVPQFYNQMSNLLASGGYLDPQVFNDQIAGVHQQYGGIEQDYQSRLAEMGMQRSAGGQAQLSAIQGAGANQAAALRSKEDTDARTRLMQLLGMLGMYGTEPGLGAGGIAEGARQFDESLAAQQGNRWLTALATMGGTAANVML